MPVVEQLPETSSKPTRVVDQPSRFTPSRVVGVVGAGTGLVWLVIYLLTVSPTVNFIDSGELITALHEPGIAHPPGYPLYTLLGYVVSHLLPGEVAWRVNVLSALAGAGAVCALYFLIVRIMLYTNWLHRPQPLAHQPRKSRARSAEPPLPTQQPSTGVAWSTLLAAVAGASLLAASATFWSRSVQAKMYTLHYLFVALVFLCAVNCRWAYDRGETRTARRWLVATAALLGLSLTNHLITTLLGPGLALLLLWGRDWLPRLRYILRQWMFWVPAFVLPLLLYLYLPIRSAQDPTMNWGSPDSFGDLWRHITGWQYSSYLGEDLSVTVGRFWGFLGEQWGLLGWILLPLALASGVLMAVRNRAVFAGTAVTGLATIVFSLKYGSSEMVPYIVPLYMMLVLWLAFAAASLRSLLRQTDPTARAGAAASSPPGAALASSGVLALLAVVALVMQYPLQNHSNDHLAELFVRNMYSNLEPDSIVLTDHWDFQSPSYYEQLVEGVRPDIVIVDKLLLKYPWYVGQLEKRYPWLIANSKDIADPYRVEQRKWVNGEPYNAAAINQLYVNLLTSFVERNIDKHPVYTFFTQPCDPNAPPQLCENNQIAPTFLRQPWGAALRLWPQSQTNIPVPPAPSFDLRGITYDKVPLDDFSRFNAGLYLSAYRTAAQIYSQENKPDVARQMNDKAAELETALNR